MPTPIASPFVKSVSVSPYSELSRNPSCSGFVVSVAAAKSDSEKVMKPLAGMVVPAGIWNAKTLSESLMKNPEISIG